MKALNRTIIVISALITLCALANAETIDMTRVRQAMAAVVAYDKLCHEVPGSVMEQIRRAYKNMTEDERLELRYMGGQTVKAGEGRRRTS